MSSSPTVTLYRAPRLGRTEGQLEQGWIPDVTFAVVPPGFTQGEQLSRTIFLTTNPVRASALANLDGFDGTIIAITVDLTFLDLCELPDPEDEDEDLQVPFEHLAVLNAFPRRLA